MGSGIIYMKGIDVLFIFVLDKLFFWLWIVMFFFRVLKEKFYLEGWNILYNEGKDFEFLLVVWERGEDKYGCVEMGEMWKEVRNILGGWDVKGGKLDFKRFLWR